MQQKDIKRIYLSGPITGNPDASRLFGEAETAVEKMGIEVVNPLKINPEDVDWLSAMRTDIKALVDCDAIMMLPGWEMSPGAKLEYDIAIRLDIAILYYKDVKIIKWIGSKQVIVDLMANAIHDILGISMDKLRDNLRNRNIVDARRIFCLLIYPYINNFTEIGRILHLDHSTIIYHQRIGSELLKYDKQFAATFEQVHKRLMDALIFKQFDQTGVNN